MPYNSSSFEKQLAKYKQAEAEKSVASMPRNKYETYEDPHKVKAKVNADRGSIKSYALNPSQLMGEGAQTTPVIVQREEPIVPIIVMARKKPFYKRTWFILFAVTTLPVLFAPVFYKQEIAQLKDVASTVKTTTGVDPLSLKTYTNMLKGKAIQPDTDIIASPVPAASAPMAIEPLTTGTQPDISTAIEGAQKKAESVTSQGAGYSMQYIEEETKRLNDAARQFDEQYKNNR